MSGSCSLHKYEGNTNLYCIFQAIKLYISCKGSRTLDCHHLPCLLCCAAMLPLPDSFHLLFHFCVRCADISGESRRQHPVILLLFVSSQHIGLKSQAGLSRVSVEMYFKCIYLFTLIINIYSAVFEFWIRFGGVCVCTLSPADGWQGMVEVRLGKHNRSENDCMK